ncbi:TIGR02285 family protein [Terasakiella sp. SH-1]|uniref:TIGR02285 family protein n=1 Tax=Terasakiella sp. SH-1 TaxID=2560057 RepID=UPI00107486E9|nr:TIGR02285 family protein [Terasakiella sp. SH-1]
MDYVLKSLIKAGVALCILATSSFNLSAKETILWTLNDFIPFYIQEGPYKGQGISDKLTAFFIKHLPHYQHKQSKMNFPRFFALAKRGDLVCNPLLLKTTEREKILAYSQPFKPAYAHIMVSTHPVNNGNGPISLRDFLKTDPHAMIVQTKRSYGPVLDEVIKEAVEAGRVKVESFPTRQLLIMLENNRIEHFIDIENTTSYYNTLHRGTRKLYKIALKEDRLDRFGYAVCSKTPAGQKLISEINDILKRKGASQEFRDILESWMATENLMRFREFYYREILKK